MKNELFTPRKPFFRFYFANFRRPFFPLWLTAELLIGMVFAYRENSVFNSYSFSVHLHLLPLRKVFIFNSGAKYLQD